jgi:hypothetical protein
MCECGGERTAKISGKVTDLCYVAVPHLDKVQHDGYVPSGLGVGGGDYLKFQLCLDCGRVQNFPEVSDKTILEELNFR